jgi:hypothetical protein
VQQQAAGVLGAAPPGFGVVPPPAPQWPSGAPFAVFQVLARKMMETCSEETVTVWSRNGDVMAVACTAGVFELHVLS